MTRQTLFGILAALLLGTGCGTGDTPPAAPAAEVMPKIDFHTHYAYSRNYLDSLLGAWNMRTVLVNVAHGDTARVRRNWRALVDHQKAYPNRFVLCTAFDATGIDEPGYADGVIRQLEADLSLGAKMVKVWKNFGLESKDRSGAYVQIDDERLQPIWTFLASRKVPVLAHIAEPLAAWQPLDPKNPHYRYYRDNPQYHAYQHPEIPRWEDIIAARDRWLERNPNLVVIGAHLGSMGHDVHVVAERLDRYPNFFVDTAARFGDLTSQNSDSVRAFFVKYQDRIVYGTDLGTGEPAPDETPASITEERAGLDHLIGLDWQYLSQPDSMTYDSGMVSAPIRTRGLGLPQDVLEKVYEKNAARLLSL